MDDRPEFDEYYLGIAEAVSKRTDCRRSQVGAVLVATGNFVASTGYPGVASGEPGCLEGQCPRGLLSYKELAAYSSYDNCISTHAEMNALRHLDKHLGQEMANKLLENSTIYVTRMPCVECWNVLADNGVTRFVWPDGYWEEF